MGYSQKNLIKTSVDKTIISLYAMSEGMSDIREDDAGKYFNCTASERAAFEAGIKMGTIYHQFVGTPLSMENVEYLERAIEASVRVQPFVKNVRVRIDRSRISKKSGFYKYLTLHGDMLDIDLEIQYGDKVAVCKLEYVKDMDYPLMYIKEIRSE